MTVKGLIVRRYAVGNHHPSSVSFGGPNMDQLFVTVTDPGALLRLSMGVRGLDIRPQR